MATLTDALKLHRSVYEIGKALPVDEEKIVRLVNEAAALVPDAGEDISLRVRIER